MFEKMSVEEMDILIVGGGICGLATALALQRKGIRSVVLERSETLRATGAAIGVWPNGWRALHHLRLDSILRSAPISFQRALDIWVDKGVVRETRMSEGEARCIKRSDLIEALANELPSGTIRFGCQVLSIDVDKSSSNPVVQLSDGSFIKAKVLIGCDGVNSVIANFIGLPPTKLFSKCEVRGLSSYPDGHGFAPEFLRIRKHNHLVGRMPIDDKTVYWFVTEGSQRDGEMPKDPTAIRALTLKLTAGFPRDIVEMIENCDLTSLSLTRLRYRAPWSLLFGKPCRGAITVAGDAWHVMGPFLGQGGPAALEDAIVLARCLSRKAYNAHPNKRGVLFSEYKAQEALDEYVKERRLRILHLSTLTYLIGLLMVENPSFLVRFLCIIILFAVFRDPFKHTRYDTGEL